MRLERAGYCTRGSRQKSGQVQAVVSDDDTARLWAALLCKGCGYLDEEKEDEVLVRTCCSFEEQNSTIRDEACDSTMIRHLSR